MNQPWSTFLPNVERETIDFIFTDPPYNVLTSEHDIIGPNDMKELAGLFFKLLKNNGRIAVFGSFDQTHKWYEYLTEVGFKIQQVPIIITHKDTSNYIIILTAYKVTVGGNSIQCRTQFLTVAHKGSTKTLDFNWKVYFIDYNSGNSSSYQGQSTKKWQLH